MEGLQTEAHAPAGIERGLAHFLTGTALAPSIVVARRTTRQRHELAVGQKLPESGIGHTFTRLSSAIATLAGTPWAFLVALGLIASWLITGPIFNFSSDWQLYVNTATTIVTFLMVFLIQNTQNRDAKAMHLKLDELLRAIPRARKEFMEAEEEDLDEIEREKEIVDEADPAPPEHKKEEEQREAQKHGRHAVPGNGKTKHF